MQTIHNLVELLNAARLLIEPLRLLTFDLLSYLGLVYALWTLLKKRRL
jgi:hypothetical protein